MQFTKVFSIIALAATGAHAFPQQSTSAGPVSVGGNYSLVSDATTKVLIGAQALSSADTATVNNLVATYIASAKSDASVGAAAIASILGEGAIFAQALTTILTTLSACAVASA